jgi:hypothetical protein
MAFSVYRISVTPSSHWRRTPAWIPVAMLAALAAALRFGGQWNARLEIAPVGGQILAGQASASDLADDPRTFQRLGSKAGMRSAEYGFVNFNSDPLQVSYRIADADFKRYEEAYGYNPEVAKALRVRRDAALGAAYRVAVASRKTQAQLDAAAAAIEKIYDLKLREYLAARGFNLESGNLTRIDMPGIVRRNGPLVKPLAETFDRIAISRGYGSIDIIGAVLSFAQTAVRFREPDAVYEGRNTGGILPPLTAIVRGFGDCDTKTALAASILSNWPQIRMIGVSVPGHYLMGVLQIPGKRDLFVEYEGLKYVLLEPSGPAWLPPGRAADETVALLKAGDGFSLHPFF